MTARHMGRVNSDDASSPGVALHSVACGRVFFPVRLVERETGRAERLEARTVLWPHLSVVVVEEQCVCGRVALFSSLPERPKKKRHIIEML